MGAQVPIILTSRASSAIARKASCALALLTVRDSKGQKQGTECHHDTAPNVVEGGW